MDETKNWWASRAVWGGLVAVLAGVAGIFGFALDAALQGEIVELVVSVVTAVSGGVAVYGRIKASKKVE